MMPKVNNIISQFTYILLSISVFGLEHPICQDKCCLFQQLC